MVRCLVAHWKLTLSYDGTGFHGWQVQPGLRTVQGTLAEALLHVTDETVLPQGSGRTDAGVHALAQVASFSLRVEIPAANLRRALNRSLPPNIRVLAAEPIADDFHARHSAVSKTYEYRVLPCRAGDQVCSPFQAPFVWACRWALNLDAMNAAAAHVTGEANFSSFAAADPDRARRAADAEEVSAVRTIFESEWHIRESLLVYRVRGSGFLHHMVRNLVGTFVDVGRGSLPAAAMPRILAARDRRAAGPTAPAQGLFLVSVDYPSPVSGGHGETAVRCKGTRA